MLLSHGTKFKNNYKICYLKIYHPVKLKQLPVIFILNQIDNLIEPGKKYIWLYEFQKTFRAIVSVIKYLG